MNTAIRIALLVAGLVAVGGGAVMVYVLFEGAAGAARRGVIADDPLSRVQAVAVDQAALVAPSYLLLSIGHLFGVMAVVRRHGRTPLKVHHLLTAAVLASATLVLIATPFLFIG